MAFLGTKELNELQQSNMIVEPFDPLRIKNGAYELSLGSEVYLTDSKTGKVEIINADNNRSVDINPGQFALLLTKEKVSVPKNKIGFISIKAGEKLKGLVNVSGFHVDPGFHDHLLFSVYNAGPSTIVLNFGDPYFPIWFAEMKTELTDDQAYNENNNHYNKLDHIPSKYIEVLKKGELASPNSLLSQIKELDKKLDIKVDELKGKKDYNKWVLQAIAVLLLGLWIKSCTDNNQLKKGYEYGINNKAVHEEVKTLNIDSIVSKRVDSILSKRLKNDTIKK